MNVSQIRTAALNKLAGTPASTQSTTAYVDFIVKANEFDLAKNKALAEATATSKSTEEYLAIVEKAEQAQLEGYLELCKEYNLEIN